MACSLQRTRNTYTGSALNYSNFSPRIKVSLLPSGATQTRTFRSFPKSQPKILENYRLCHRKSTLTNPELSQVSSIKRGNNCLKKKASDASVTFFPDVEGKTKKRLSNFRTQVIPNGKKAVPLMHKRS